jgi:PAS domain S-box-containing protein
VFISAVAHLYKRARRKAAAYDQELALREMRQEKEFLANLLEHGSQPFAVGYPDGRLGRLNHAYEQLTGYSAAELRALNWSATLTPPEWRELEKQKLDELNRTGQPVRYEKECIRKDGSRVPIELLVHLVRDAEGKPEYYYSFLTDITERKRAEDTLRFLVQCGTTGSAEGFFQELARYLAQSLGMDYVCIDRLKEDSLAAQTVAVFSNGKFEDNVSYTLKDTPCGAVVGKTICCFPKDVRRLFPKDSALQDLQAESYLGTTLWSSQGQPIGLIAVIGRQPLADTRLAESVLQLVAVRAAGELERQRTE